MRGIFRQKQNYSKTTFFPPERGVNPPLFESLKGVWGKKQKNKKKIDLNFFSQFLRTK